MYLDEYGNPFSMDGNSIFDRPYDPWAALTEKYGLGLNTTYGQKLAAQLGLDPAQAAQLWEQGITANQGSPYFSGAIDTSNANLLDSWGALGILQGTNNLASQYTDPLAQYADQGYQTMNANRAQDKANRMANLTKFGVGLASLALPGVLGMYPGQTGGLFNGLGAGSEWVSGFDLPMGEASSIFGSDAAAAAGGLTETVVPEAGMDWVSGFDLPMGNPDYYLPIQGTVGSGAQYGNIFQRAALEASGLNPMGMYTGAGEQASNLLGSVGSSLGQSAGFWDSLLKGSKTLGSLFGGGGSNDLFGGSLNLGGLLGKGLDMGLALGPSIAAINYAKNQEPYDTSRLESLYSQYSPNALASQYDLNTAGLRSQLNSNLARRGVLGSSFGQFDMNSFDTLRDIGRQAVINQGVGTAGGLANSILNAQALGTQQKNDLYGRALMSMGLALGGR